jgi:hypothetical protein
MTTSLMKYFSCVLFVLMLATGCTRQSGQSNSVAMNTVESVKYRQVMHEGAAWVEVTLTQHVDRKAPAYVVGIRDSKWANRLRWVLFEQTIEPDRVVSRFRFKPVGQTNEITLNRDDFDWYPRVSGFEPMTVLLREVEPGGAGDGNQPSRSETQRVSEAAGSRR